MKFTFGICAGNLTMLDIGHINACIRAQGIPDDDYEILYIGAQGEYDGWCLGEQIRWIEFDESQKSKAWITRKKNILAQEAKFENIVFMHDYFRLGNAWFDGWISFGNDFEVACNCIMTKEGFRHSDWLIDPYLLWDVKPELKGNFWELSLEYDNVLMGKYQYISGGYWVAKKQFMLENPLNEDLVWGDAEDIEWSRRVRQKTTFQFNPHSYVAITKPGKWAPGLIPHEYLTELLAAGL